MGENFMIGVPKGVGPLKMKEKIRFVLEFRKFLFLSFYSANIYKNGKREVIRNLRKNEFLTVISTKTLFEAFQESAKLAAISLLFRHRTIPCRR